MTINISVQGDKKQNEIKKAPVLFFFSFFFFFCIFSKHFRPILKYYEYIECQRDSVHANKTKIETKVN